MTVTEFLHGSSNVDALCEAFREGTLGTYWEKSRDAGDFGTGLYCTRKPSRAMAYGTVVGVQIDLARFAFVPNPYFIEGFDEIKPRSDAEVLFHDIAYDREGKMATVTGPLELRREVAQRLRERFMAAGFDGIKTSYESDIVVFDSGAVRGLTIPLGDPS